MDTETKPVKPVKKPAKKPVKKPAKRGVGRTRLLTPELETRFLDLLRLGNYAVNACGSVGISEAVYYHWMRRGEDEHDRLMLLKGKKAVPIPAEAQFLQFFESVKKAKSEARTLAHGIIMREAINGDWKAAAWMLARTAPDQYSEKIQNELSTKSGQPLELEISIASIEDKVNQVLANRKK